MKVSRERIYCVIEPGSNRVNALAFNGVAPDLVPLAFASEPINGMWKGEVTDHEKCAEGIRSVLRTIQSSLGKAPEMVFGAASSQHFSSSISQGFVPIIPKGRLITKDDILQVVNHSRQSKLAGNLQEIQVAPIGFRIDGKPISRPPIGQPASRLEVDTYIGFADRSEMQMRSRVFASAGANCNQFILGAFASGLGVLTKDERELGTICIDLGESKTDFSVFMQGGLAYTSTLPVGGRNVTQDIAGLLKTSHEEAERLKLRFGAAMAQLVAKDQTVEVVQIGQSGPRPLQLSVLCEIIESRMKEIFKLCLGNIEKSIPMKELLGGAVITGGGSQLRGVAALLEHQFHVKRVRLGLPELDFSALNHDPSIEPSSLSALAGMAYFAHEDSDDELATASHLDELRHRVRTLWSILSNSS